MLIAYCRAGMHLLPWKVSGFVRGGNRTGLKPGGDAMGLDAFVYCDCVEKGRTTIPHPFPDLLYITECGEPWVATDDEDVIEQHEQWVAQHPCPHEDFFLDGYFLGNMSAIGFLREAVRQLVGDPESECPVLWNGVIYSGTHTGDYLTPDEAKQLKRELKKIRKLSFEKVRLPNSAQELRDLPDDQEPDRSSWEPITADVQQWMEEILTKLESLADSSAKVNKPIAF